MANPIKRVWNFYVEGFKSMTLGKTLWAIILIKLFVMFFILKMFFFPNHIKQNAVNNDKAGYVGKELIERGIPLNNE